MPERMSTVTMPQQPCQQCGTLFVPARKGVKYCGRKCQQKQSAHTARATHRSTNRLGFVGVDGEGVDRPDGVHEYVMLSVGADTLWRNGRQLLLGEILSFLWEQYCSNPEACYVGFYLGYDFVQWFKQLPQDKAHLLFTNAGIASRKSTNPLSRQKAPQPVVWEGWEMDILAGRRIKLRPHTHVYSPWTGACRNRTCGHSMEDDGDRFGEPQPDEYTFDDIGTDGVVAWAGSAAQFWKQFKPAKRVKGWMYICDTGPFWQCSFLKAIDPSGWPVPVCSHAEYQTIVEGKADRGLTAEYGETSFFSDMQRYNVLENDVLSRITERLNEGFLNDAITIKIPKSDWYGPGRAAQLWMDMLHDRVAQRDAVAANRILRADTTSGGLSPSDRSNEMGLLNADVYMSMPAWYVNAARASYYGGWFEQFMHGHIGDVWEYDINSAYPFIIASLPCLHTDYPHNGSYRQGSGSDYPDDGLSYTLLCGTVRGSDPFIGAAPYRTKQGAILRPHVTKGWYWKHELSAAKRAGLVDSMEVEEWVSYQPCDCTPPFNPADIGIERMYALRLQVGKNSPEGKAFKLVYNSAYGKTAQSIGQPKYSNPVYASLITAGCRTLILDAIATHPEQSKAVSMVATDGIYFTSPHPSLEISSNRLGLWDVSVKTGFTQLMPGVYWDDKTRERIRDGGTPSLKSRGVNAKDLASQIESLDGLFARGLMSLEHHSESTMGEHSGGFVWPEITFHVGFLLDSCKLALQRGKWNTAGRVTHGANRSISSNPESKRIPVPFIDQTLGVIRTSPYHESPSGIESLPYPKFFGQPMVDEGFYGDRVGRDGDDGLQWFRDIIKE